MSPLPATGTASATVAEQRWPVTLRCGAVGLRPMRRRDEAAWTRVRARNQAWLGPWESTPPPFSPRPSSFAAMVREQHRMGREGRACAWALEVSADGRRPVFAGQVTLGGILYGSARWAQVGYWIDERWAGRGYVPLAVALATDYAFDVVKLHRVEVCIRPENTKSVRVVEKLGFRYEGRRFAYLHIDGDWRDHDVYVLTAGEVPGGLVARVESGC